jgi:predicted Zn-dependent protease
MRRVRQQLPLAFLTASVILVAALPLYSGKDLNNPDKIGHRNVAHRCLISPEKEAAIVKDFAPRFEQSVEIVQDPVIQRYVSKVAENLAHNSDWKGPVIVRVVKSPVVNSVSLPGAFIYLSSALVLKAENEDQVAGAIAHQIAHAAARHWASELTKSTILQFGVPPLISFSSASSPPIYTTTGMPVSSACSGFLVYHYDPQGRPSAPYLGDSLYAAYMPGVPLTFIKFRRQDELEADYLGLQYMYKAGYDPGGYVDLLRKLALMQPPSPLPDSLQAMPPFSERIAKADQEIRTILPNLRTPAKPGR